MTILCERGRHVMALRASVEYFLREHQERGVVQGGAEQILQTHHCWRNVRCGTHYIAPRTIVLGYGARPRPLDTRTRWQE